MTPQPLAPAAGCLRHPCPRCLQEFKDPYKKRMNRAEGAGLILGWTCGSAPTAAGLLLLTFNPAPLLQFGLGPALLAAGIAVCVGTAMRCGRRMNQIRAEMNRALAAAGLAGTKEKSSPCRC